jgi:Domain of unknown function (DUF929)
LNKDIRIRPAAVRAVNDFEPSHDASTPPLRRKAMSNNREVVQRRAEAEAASRKARSRRSLALGIWAVILVVVAVTCLALISSLGGNTTAVAGSSSPASGTPIPTALVRRLQSITLQSLVNAPAGGLDVSPTGINDPKLDSDGKPDLLYIGAEFCPVCATERWAMYVALSKFGTFSPEPGEIHSAVRDGDIPTLTFYKTKFSSPYLTFTPVETTTNEPEGDYYELLQKPSAEQLKLWESHTQQSFPWIDFGGQKELNSAQYDPSVLQGMTFNSIASQIGDNSTVVGADVDASARVLVKTICSTMTSDNPAAVCTAVGEG